MVKIAVVEDEKLFMDKLLEYLEQYQKEIGEKLYKTFPLFLFLCEE